MPRLIVDIDRVLFERVDTVLGTGSYQSFSELVRVALENQLQLETSELSVAEKEDAGMATTDAGTAEPPAALSELSLGSMPPTPRLAPPLRDDQLVLSDSPADAYLWGQINRLFPVKIALRELWRLSEEGPVGLQALQSKAAVKARDIGLWIRKVEDGEGVRRSDSHWVGLPVGASAEKSLSRFKSHFVGYPRSSDGVFEGALFRLKLAGIIGESEGLGLTSAGAAWARLSNPILDEGEFGSGSLSAQETDFYMSHVLADVDEERKPLVETLQIISGGGTSAPSIDAALARMHSDWSSNVVTTMRSGNLSRLWELGLVKREGPFGSTVFALTPAGIAVLDRLAP